MSEDALIQDSSGNVFEDMGMRDAEERLAKAELARLIRLEIPTEAFPKQKLPLSLA